MSETPNTTRHGKRAPGTATITVPVPECLKRQLEKLAAGDQRSLAAYLRIKLADLTRRSAAARNSTARVSA